MKIAYVNSYFSPVITGGQKVDKMICDSLSKKYGSIDYIYNNLKYEEIGSKFKLMIKCLGFFNRLKKYNICLVNSTDGFYLLPLVVLLRLFTKVKIINIHHHYAYLAYSGFKRLRYFSIEDTFLKLSNSILTVSPYIYDLTKQKYQKKHIGFCQIPFDRNNELTEDTKQPNSLLYVGTIEPRKGFIYLIEALKILKDKNIEYELKIVGKDVGGKYSDDIKNKINEYKLNVNYTGHLSDEDLHTLYQNSSIFVFPSLLEGFGMVLVEAMSYGIPVICFNNSAMPYVIKDNVTGLVVENMSSEKFAEALEKLLTNDKFRKEISKNAFETAKNYPTKNEFYLNIQKYIENLTK